MNYREPRTLLRPIHLSFRKRERYPLLSLSILLFDCPLLRGLECPLSEIPQALVLRCPNDDDVVRLVY